MKRSNDAVDSSTCNLVSVFDFFSLAARVSTGSKIRFHYSFSTIVNGSKSIRISTRFQSASTIFPEAPTGRCRATLVFLIKSDTHRRPILFELFVLYGRRRVDNRNSVRLSLVEISDRNVGGMSQHCSGGMKGGGKSELAIDSLVAREGSVHELAVDFGCEI